MVSQTTRYALIILGHLAERAETWSPVDEIAHITCIPANYLSKILNRLAKEGMVESLKGWGGGYRLHPAAAGRPIRDVLRIMEGREPGVVQECVFGLPGCDAKAPCPLHQPWQEIRESYERMMSGISIGELRSEPAAAARRRCDDPPIRRPRRSATAAASGARASKKGSARQKAAKPAGAAAKGGSRSR